MSNAAFNIAFGAFLSAGLDYATCAKKAQEVVDTMSPKTAPPPVAPVPAPTPASAQDIAQGPRESQAAFVLRACDGQWRTRSWLAERINADSKHKSAVRTCCDLVLNGRLKRMGPRSNPSYMTSNSTAVAPPVQAELPVVHREPQDDDSRQRDDENQPEFMLRACAGQWRPLAWLAARINTESPYPKGPASAACNKLIRDGRMESKGKRGSVCYRTKVQP